MSSDDTTKFRWHFCAANCQIVTVPRWESGIDWSAEDCRKLMGPNGRQESLTKNNDSTGPEQPRPGYPIREAVLNIMAEF